jgi:hypothetical protein
MIANSRKKRPSGAGLKFTMMPGAIGTPAATVAFEMACRSVDPVGNEPSPLLFFAAGIIPLLLVGAWFLIR